MRTAVFVIPAISVLIVVQPCVLTVVAMALAQLQLHVFVGMVIKMITLAMLAIPLYAPLVVIVVCVLPRITVRVPLAGPVRSAILPFV